MTHHNARVAYLSWLDSRTLIYSATAEDGSGLWFTRWMWSIVSRIALASVSGTSTCPLQSAKPVRTDRRQRRTAHREPVDGSFGRHPTGDFCLPLVGPECARSRTALRRWLPAVSLRSWRWRWTLATRWDLPGNYGRAAVGLVAPPAIAPDGGRICFPYRREGHARLSVMDSNGTAWRPWPPRSTCGVALVVTRWQVDRSCRRPRRWNPCVQDPGGWW